MSDPVKSIKEQLVDLFNAALIAEGVEAAYTVDDVTFGEVEAYDEGTFDPNSQTDHNTSVEVTVGEFLEQVTSRLHYTRYNLATLVGLRAPSFAGDADATSTYDVLDEVNEHIKVELTVEDVSDELVDDGLVTLKAIPQSLLVFGEATLVIEGGTNPQARGFVAPAAPEPTSEPTGETDGDEPTGETTGDEEEQV